MMATTIKCLKCEDVITSKGHRHNFVQCSCGACFVDGGDSYGRIGGDFEHIRIIVDGIEKKIGELEHE